ncbi:MAG: UDP-N-acetylmuramate dehydrogenase [Actinomycetaceae bacterium]|nr:UDP-N-acetylmuramate dehydrogenase [Actinomycetaceae bacterium]
MTCPIPERSAVPPRPSAPVPHRRARQGATSFAELTTIGVGGTFSRLVEATSEEEIIETVRQADAQGVPLMFVGGGSNILAADGHFPGVVLRDARSQITLVQEGGCEGANLRVAGGTSWDEFVVHTIENEWMGVEALSGIPGTVGAAPVQNIGAYGQEVAGSIARVRVYDRQTGRPDELPMADMRFGYRTSRIKESLREGWGPSPRYIVLSVDFQLRIASLSAPVQYGQLAAALGVEPGARVPSADLREAVLELRRSKGMVLDDADRDTYSCGSFFTNPIVDEQQAARLPQDAPRFGVTDGSRATLGAAAPKVAGQVKTSAAWLIDHAGFPAGYGMPGPAALSTKHCLALTNRGGASGEQMRELVRTIQAGVRQAFGVDLEPEPVIMADPEG